MFDGRRVYWRMVVLVTVALRSQRPCGMTLEKLKGKLGVDSKTVWRWQAWYRERLSVSGEWRDLCSRFALGLEPGKEVQGLIAVFIDEKNPENGMARLLRFIAEFEHVSPGRGEFTQKMVGSQDRK